MHTSTPIKILIRKMKINHLCNKKIDSIEDRVKVLRGSLNNPHSSNRKQVLQKLYHHLQNKNLICMVVLGGKISLEVYLLIEGIITINQISRKMLGSISKY